MREFVERRLEYLRHRYALSGVYEGDPREEIFDALIKEYLAILDYLQKQELQVTDVRVIGE